MLVSGTLGLCWGGAGAAGLEGAGGEAGADRGPGGGGGGGAIGVHRTAARGRAPTPHVHIMEATGRRPAAEGWLRDDETQEWELTGLAPCCMLLRCAGDARPTGDQLMVHWPIKPWGRVFDVTEVILSAVRRGPVSARCCHTINAIPSQ